MLCSGGRETHTRCRGWARATAWLRGCAACVPTTDVSPPLESGLKTHLCMCDKSGHDGPGSNPALISKKVTRGLVVREFTALASRYVFKGGGGRERRWKTEENVRVRGRDDLVAEGGPCPGDGPRCRAPPSRAQDSSRMGAFAR